MCLTKAIISSYSYSCLYTLFLSLIVQCIHTNTFTSSSGVQTALKHDTLIEGGDPDSIIVESEANRIAQSAARALRESCRQCQGGGGGGATWGQPTWTGQHGTVGAPKYAQRERGEVTSGSVKMIKIHNAPTFVIFLGLESLRLTIQRYVHVFTCNYT